MIYTLYCTNNDDELVSHIDLTSYLPGNLLQDLSLRL